MSTKMGDKDTINSDGKVVKNSNDGITYNDIPVPHEIYIVYSYIQSLVKLYRMNLEI